MRGRRVFLSEFYCRLWGAGKKVICKMYSIYNIVFMLYNYFVVFKLQNGGKG